jgi:hypothetical protein
VNLERLGLVDTEALFRDQEKRDRALEREKMLGRGSGSMRDIDRFLRKTCSQASLIRDKARYDGQIRRDLESDK